MTQRRDDDSFVVPLVAISIAALCFAFQETSLLPALTAIRGSLPGASTSTTSFLESGYLVVAAVSAPTLGKIGDRRGRKNIILVAMGLYFLGAVGAALTPNFAMLVVFRAVQGAGGAIFAMALAIMRKLAGPKLPIAIGTIVGTFGVGITAGFASAGVITSDLGWRWLFGIEAMLITLGASLIFFFVPDTGERSDVDRDLPGAAMLGFGIGSILLALTFGSEWGWTAWRVLFLFVAGPILLAGWWLRDSRIEQPLLAVQVLKDPNILFPNLAGGLAGYAAFSTYLLVPRLLGTPAKSGFGFGLSLTQTGIVMMSIGLGTLVGSQLGGQLSQRFGGKWVFTAGMGVLAAGPALLATVRPDLPVVAIWLFLTGMGFGASVGAGGTFVTQAAPEGSTGVATSFNTLSRLVGGGIGSQIATIILLAGRVPHTKLSHESAYVIAFTIAAAVAAGGAFLASLTRAASNT